MRIHQVIRVCSNPFRTILASVTHDDECTENCTKFRRFTWPSVIVRTSSCTRRGLNMKITQWQITSKPRHRTKYSNTKTFLTKSYLKQDLAQALKLENIQRKQCISES